MHRCAAKVAAMVMAVGMLSACGTGGPFSDEGGLRPLSTQPAVPAGAPRSRVPAVNYELGTPGTGDDGPQDGVPGDQGPREIFERGGASWYGIQFHQRKTASGERFDMAAMTAAHKTLPFNTRVCVRSLVNGREVMVRINDRGPYASGRIIDLSRAAADELGMVGVGIKQVALSIIDRDGMRCGTETVGPLTPISTAPDGDSAKSANTKPAAKPRKRR